MKTYTQDNTKNNTKKTTNSDSNSKLVEQEKLPGTPFTLIRYEDQWFLTLGKYRLTEGVKTKALAIKDAKRADWYRVMQIINIMLDERIEQLKTTLNK